MVEVIWKHVDMEVVSKLPSVPMSEIQASEYSAHKLLKLCHSIVKRKHGSKLLVIKFNLCLHFLENQLDFGVTSNVDTGPMESNHKCNAKKPSGQTQRCADSSYKLLVATSKIRATNFSSLHWKLNFGQSRVNVGGNVSANPLCQVGSTLGWS